MGDRNIKKEPKKMKKSDKKPLTALASSESKPVMTQPEVIKKERKPK